MAWELRKVYTEGAVTTDAGKEKDVINEVNETLEVFWVICKTWI